VRLVRLGLSGGEPQRIGEPGLLTLLDVSRDGLRALLQRQDPTRGGYDLWVVEIPGGRATRATFAGSESDFAGAFSPDGERLVVLASSGGQGWASGTLKVQAASGGGESRTLLESARFMPAQWSPDGRVLVGTVQETETAHDIAWLALDDPGTIHKCVATPFIERPIGLSPDGRWLAYASDETGAFELYVTDFPEARRKWQISSGVSAAGTWSPQGDAVYYADREGRFVAVPLRARGESLEVLGPRTLDVRVPAGVSFGVTREGLLTLEPESKAAPEPVRLARNWKRLLE
jgi:Tol biopolymer transport system component